MRIQGFFKGDDYKMRKRWTPYFIVTEWDIFWQALLINKLTVTIYTHFLHTVNNTSWFWWSFSWARLFETRLFQVTESNWILLCWLGLGQGKALTSNPNHPPCIPLRDPSKFLNQICRECPDSKWQLESSLLWNSSLTSQTSSWLKSHHSTACSPVSWCTQTRFQQSNWPLN